MMLTCLIPSHRPKLLKRCISSVLDKTFVKKIFVNDQTKTFSTFNLKINVNYNISTNLSIVYKSLLDKVNDNDFVWFLEDDDYCVANAIIKSNCITIFPYIPVYFTETYFITVKKIWNRRLSKEEFIVFLMKSKLYKYFQLGLIAFKKSWVNFLNFPNDNNIYNDFKLFCNLNCNYVFIYPSFIWRQTFDDLYHISSQNVKDKRFINNQSEYDFYLKTIKEVYGESLYSLCSS